MATASWTITEDDVYSLLQLAPAYNNDNATLEFEADEIPPATATTLVQQLLVLHETKNLDFEPWGRKLARWANTNVPVVEDAIAQAAVLRRVTETGDERVTEDGTPREIEG